MIAILHGIRRFNARRIGLRRDFCSSCRQVCVSELWESSDWLHLFFIPWFPLGRRERWLCPVCRQNPRAVARTRKTFRILGLFFLPPVFISVFLSVLLEAPSDATEYFTTLLMPAVCFLVWLHLVRETFFKPPEPSDDERRKAVLPLSSDECFICRRPLARHPRLHCPSCALYIEAAPTKHPPAGPPPLPPPLPPSAPAPPVPRRQEPAAPQPQFVPEGERCPLCGWRNHMANCPNAARGGQK